MLRGLRLTLRKSALKRGGREAEARNKRGAMVRGVSLRGELNGRGIKEPRDVKKGQGEGRVWCSWNCGCGLFWLRRFKTALAEIDGEMLFSRRSGFLCFLGVRVGQL